MIDRWEGREGFEARKTYARFCREHDLRMNEETLRCPFPPGIGHDLVSASDCFTDANDDEDKEPWVTKEVGPPLTEAQSRAKREALAWAAGVFDCKGSARVISYKGSKNGRLYYRVAVRIVLKERTILEEVARAVGVGFVALDRGGRADQPARGRWGHEKERFGYLVSGWTGVKFLMAIWPFLRQKRRYVQELLAGQISGAVK